MRALTALPCLVLTLSPAGSARAEEGRPEQARLQGTWQVVRIEAAGTTLPDKMTRDFRLTFKGDTILAHMGQDRYQGTYHLDVSRRPWKMDILPGTGPDKGKVQHALCALEGNTLKICGAGAGRERPTAFETAGKEGHTLMVLRRQP